MKLNKVKEIQAFLQAVDNSVGDVYLTTKEGDKLNLKSKLTQYVAIAALINSDNDLELWCDKHEDEQHFFKFFLENPDTVF